MGGKGYNEIHLSQVNHSEDRTTYPEFSSSSAPSTLLGLAVITRDNSTKLTVMYQVKYLRNNLSLQLCICSSQLLLLFLDAMNQTITHPTLCCQQLTTISMHNLRAATKWFSLYWQKEDILVDVLHRNGRKLTTAFLFSPNFTLELIPYPHIKSCLTLF